MLTLGSYFLRPWFIFMLLPGELRCDSYIHKRQLFSRHEITIHKHRAKPIFAGEESNDIIIEVKVRKII